MPSLVPSAVDAEAVPASSAPAEAPVDAGAAIFWPVLEMGIKTWPVAVFAL